MSEQSNRVKDWASAGEAIRRSADAEELRAFTAAASDLTLNAAIQVGIREMEERQTSREREDANRQLAAVKDLCERYQDSEHAVRQAIRTGKLTPVFAQPGAKRNAKLVVGDYLRWRSTRQSRLQ